MLRQDKKMSDNKDQTLDAVPEVEVETVEVTPKGKEETGKMPTEMFVIPIFGRPIMPSQITPVQLSAEWEDTITKIAQTESKLFAVFSVGEKSTNKKILTPDDYPKTGCVVRLLHAKVGGGEIHFIGEGICRVQIEKWLDFKTESLAKVTFPEPQTFPTDDERAVEIRGYAMTLVASIQELLPLNPLYTDQGLHQIYKRS